MEMQLGWHSNWKLSDGAIENQLLIEKICYKSVKVT